MELIITLQLLLKIIKRNGIDQDLNCINKLRNWGEQMHLTKPIPIHRKSALLSVDDRLGVAFVLAIIVGFTIPNRVLAQDRVLQGRSSEESIVASLPRAEGIYVWTDDIKALSSAVRSSSLYHEDELEKLWRVASTYSDDLSEEESRIEDEEYAQLERLLLTDGPGIFAGPALLARVKGQGEDEFDTLFLAETEGSQEAIQQFIRDVTCFSLPGAEGDRLRHLPFDDLSTPFSWQMRDEWLCCSTDESLIDAYLSSAVQKAPEKSLLAEQKNAAALARIKPHDNSRIVGSFLITPEFLPRAAGCFLRPGDLLEGERYWAGDWEMLHLDEFQTCAGHFFSNDDDSSPTSLSADCFLTVDGRENGVFQSIPGHCELNLDLPACNDRISWLTQFCFNGQQLARYIEQLVVDNENKSGRDASIWSQIRRNPDLPDIVERSCRSTTYGLVNAELRSLLSGGIHTIDVDKRKDIGNVLVKLANETRSREVLRSLDTENMWTVVSPKPNTTIVRYSDEARAAIQALIDKLSEETRKSTTESYERRRRRTGDVDPMEKARYIDDRVASFRKRAESTVNLEFLAVNGSIIVKGLSPQQVQAILNRAANPGTDPIAHLRERMDHIERMSHFKNKPCGLLYRPVQGILDQVFPVYPRPKLTREFWDYYRQNTTEEGIIRAARKEPKWYGDTVNLFRHWYIKQYLEKRNSEIVAIVEKSEGGFHIAVQLGDALESQTE